MSIDQYTLRDEKFHHIRKMIEDDLDAKIKEKDALEKRIFEFKELRVLVNAALLDAGHDKLAEVIWLKIGSI